MINSPKVEFNLNIKVQFKKEKNIFVKIGRYSFIFPKLESELDIIFSIKSIAEFTDLFMLFLYK